MSYSPRTAHNELSNAKRPSQCYEKSGFKGIGVTLAGAWAGGTEYGVNFVLLNKIVCFVFMCHIVPICHFSVDLEFSHT